MAERFHWLHSVYLTAKQRCQHLESRIDKFKRKAGANVDEGFHQDLKTIVAENIAQIPEAHPPDSFRRIFWEQQAGSNKPKQLLRQTLIPCGGIQ